MRTGSLRAARERRGGRREKLREEPIGSTERVGKAEEGTRGREPQEGEKAAERQRRESCVGARGTPS